MTLQNLLGINRLQAHNTDAAAVQKLLASARRNLADAHVAGISTDNRFDAAYKTIMQCAMLGLWANGYRASTSQPGHHQTALQVLPKTLGLERDVVIVSLTASDPQWAARLAEFYFQPQRLNVAATRARSKLVLIGRGDWTSLFERRPDLEAMGQNLSNLLDRAHRIAPSSPSASWPA